MSSARWSMEQYQEHLSRDSKEGLAAEKKPAPTRFKTGRANAKTTGAALLLLHIRGARLPEPVQEFEFALPRKWRADFAFVDHKLLIEYEGGIWTGGDHTRGKRYQSDCEKYNEAALLGFRVLRFTYDHVESGLALKQIERALQCSQK